MARTGLALLGNVGDVVWANCTTPLAVPGAECGYALVPLDYHNQTAGVAKIALGRYNATSPNRKGSIFFNPGGPGGDGVSLATVQGQSLQGLVGEEWDIIGFDPRGIGLSEPMVQCFPGSGNREAFVANTVLDRGYDVSPNLTDPSNRYHLIETQRDANALYRTQFEACAQVQGDSLRYMGTTSVVRDLDFITTALEGKNSLINFYGWSYGTIMGQYLVNMFPHRVGRVVIDGVADAKAWANEPPYVQVRTWVNSTEAAYRIFFEECAKAGPFLCALAKEEDENPMDIYRRVEGFIDDLYNEPLAVSNATSPGILTNGRARSMPFVTLVDLPTVFLMRSLEQPETWSFAVTALDAAMQGQAALLLNAISFKVVSDPDLQRSAVSCNDEKPFAPLAPETVVDAGLEALQNVSRFYFSALITEPDSGCQYWPFTPPERYTGPWNRTPKNPILIISNTADPITPLVNGELVHSYFPNSSALLVLDSPGHTSALIPSNCTIEATRRYFADGTLPPPGTVCQPNFSPFSSPVQDPPLPPTGPNARAFDTESGYYLSNGSALRRLPSLLARRRRRLL